MGVIDVAERSHGVFRVSGPTKAIEPLVLESVEVVQPGLEQGRGIDELLGRLCDLVPHSAGGGAY